MAYKLSILIPSMHTRELFRKRLLDVVNPQLTKYVELLIDIDGGEVSIGVKRQRMIEKAKGEYIAFADDDDLISSSYVRLVLKALKKNPDVLGIALLHYIDYKLFGKSFHSLQYDHWWDEPDPDNPGGYFFYRCPNHLNPVKRELALKAGYPDLKFGEDHEYSRRLLKLLETEEYITEPIYYYYERAKKNDLK